MTDKELDRLADEWAYGEQIEAFIAGFNAGRAYENEACAEAAETFNTFPCALSTVGKVIAASMKDRMKEGE